MNKDDDQGGRSLAPRFSRSVDASVGTALRDPLARAADIARADDPSLGELVAFRRQPIDLKAAARQARSLDSEEFRLWLSRSIEDHDVQQRACAGLQIMSLAFFTALTAIWPADDLDKAEAKLALAEKSGAILPRRERDFVRGIEPEHARRLRWKRTAFQVPALMLPPAPAAPRPDDRGLANWPLERFDLTEGLALRGDVPAFADRQVGLWTSFTGAAPDLDAFARRAETMFETSDRLATLADQAPENASELMTASEGAMIAAYLAAAQVMIWPVHDRHSLATKKKVVALVNLRAETDDPVHMQAAIRHIAAEAAWVKSLPFDARDRLSFDWVEIV